MTRRGEASPLAGQRRSGGDGSCQFVLSHRDYLPLLLFTLSCERQRHSYGIAIVSALICNGRDRSTSLVGFDLAMFGNSSRLSQIFKHPRSNGTIVHRYESLEKPVSIILYNSEIVNSLLTICVSVKIEIWYFLYLTKYFFKHISADTIYLI